MMSSLGRDLSLEINMSPKGPEFQTAVTSAARSKISDAVWNRDVCVQIWSPYWFLTATLVNAAKDQERQQRGATWT